jgi:hypothetical protein
MVVYPQVSFTFHSQAHMTVLSESGVHLVLRACFQVDFMLVFFSE